MQQGKERGHRVLTPEEFKEVVTAVADDKLTHEQAKAMLTTIYELDANLVILQNTVELAVSNATELLPAMVERTLTMTGRTDGKIKKKAAKFAADVTAKYEVAVQLYLSQAFEQAEDMLNKLATGEISLIEETEPTQEAETNE